MPTKRLKYEKISFSASSMLKFSVKFWPSEKNILDTLKVFKNGQPVYRQGHVCSLYRCHDLALLLPARPS